MRSWRLVAGAGLGSIVLAAVACGGSEDDAPTPYEIFMNDYAETLCGTLAPCCAALDYSVDDCRTWLGFAASQAGLARENLFVFHRDRADLCLADLRDVGVCDGVEPESCRAVVEGKLAGGEVCKAPAECAGNERSPGSCSPGSDGTSRCEFIGRVAKRGEPCAGDCTDGLRCRSDDAGRDAFCYEEMGLWCSEGICQDFDAIGAPCTGFFSCVSGASCSGGRCVALGEPGTRCTTTAQCNEETYCSGGSCLARLPAGSACDEELDSCQGGLCEGGRCADFRLEVLCAFGSFG